MPVTRYWPLSSFLMAAGYAHHGCWPHPSVRDRIAVIDDGKSGAQLKHPSCNPLHPPAPPQRGHQAVGLALLHVTQVVALIDLVEKSRATGGGKTGIVIQKESQTELERAALLETETIDQEVGRAHGREVLAMLFLVLIPTGCCHLALIALA